MTAIEKQVLPYLEKLRALGFVNGVEFSPNARAAAALADGVLRVRTPRGAFAFDIGRNNSYLDRSLINAWISHAAHKAEKGRALLLFTRYVPLPSAERFVEAGVNFVDQAGNMHLVLGPHYSHSVIGRRETKTVEEARPPSASRSQLLFAFAAFEEAPAWSVRRLAEVSGVSKSNVAKLRKQLVDEGILTNAFHFRKYEALAPQLLGAYEVLRPKRMIKRFRAPGRQTAGVLQRLRETLSTVSTKWSLTGGPAAYELQHFYKGIEIPVFVDSLPDSSIRKLLLLPDKTGPLIFLKSFGTVPYWKKVGGKTIAHPWLVYSELMYSSDPRAHEAAEQLKAEFLKP
jgi:hypothetical protein